MTLKWAHFVAIGGTGMGALAALMQDLGYFVTGSDGPLYPPMSTFLESRKIPLVQSYSSEHLHASFWKRQELVGLEHPTLVIVGNAISKGHPEATAVENLLEKGLTQRMSFAEGLAHFCIRGTKSFVVAGTHGKTTTTSLLAWILEAQSLNPGFFIGGIPKNFGMGCRVGGRKIFVSEGDEYDTAYWDKESKFLHYLPDWVLCTGIEFDHADIFKDVRAVELAFEKLVTKTKMGWVLIDDESGPRKESLRNFSELCKKQGLKLLRYGFASSSPYRILEVKAAPHPNGTEIGSQISIDVPGWGRQSFFSPTIGNHNALNLCGILATLKESGEVKTPEEFQKALTGFLGIKRRQDEVFKSKDMIVIDDFAHHPTAIRETLKGLRMRYPAFEVAAFFEPRSATSGRNVLAEEFSQSFDEADAIFLTPCSKSNIPEAERLNVNEVIEKSLKRGASKKQGFVKADPDALAEAFKNWSDGIKQKKPSTKFLAVVMSNGAFGGLHKKLADIWTK